MLADSGAVFHICVSCFIEKGTGSVSCLWDGLRKLNNKTVAVGA